MLLAQGRDQLSSPRSLTMDSSERNGEYKLLVELTNLVEHSRARLAILKHKASKSNKLEFIGLTKILVLKNGNVSSLA